MTATRLLLSVLVIFVLFACDRDSGPGDAAGVDPQTRPGPDEAERVDDEETRTAGEPVLEIAIELPAPATAMVASADNRLFVALRDDDDQNPALVELDSDGQAEAWPDSTPPDSGRALTGIRALHIDDEGALWILDAGPRLLRVDLMQDQFTREIRLDEAFPDAGHQPDGLGVDAELGVAYIIDSGEPGLVVLDMYTDEARRMLEDTPALRPATDEGNGRAHMVLSPDLRYLLWQPRGSSDIYRLETEVMQFTELDTEELTSMVEHFGTPGPARALAMDPAGLLYVAVIDDDESVIVRIDHFGTPDIVSREAALAGITAMSSTRGGDLLIGVDGDGDKPPRLLRLLGATQ